MTINNASVISTYKSMIPVQIKIGAEYFQVTTVGFNILYISYNLCLLYSYASKKYSGV